MTVPSIKLVVTEFFQPSPAFPQLSCDGFENIEADDLKTLTDAKREFRFNRSLFIDSVVDQMSFYMLLDK